MVEVRAQLLDCAKPSRVAVALRELRSESIYSRDRDLVFCHPDTGKPLDRSKRVRRFKQAIDRAGVHRITQ